jgi:mRNA interferase MazF
VFSFGDVVLTAGGAYSSKPRPVLVVQNNECFTGESLVIIPFTSVGNLEILTRIAVKPSSKNGLDRDCFLEVDKISAVRVTSLSETIGSLEKEYLNQTKKVLSVLLELQ